MINNTELILIITCSIGIGIILISELIIHQTVKKIAKEEHNKSRLEQLERDRNYMNSTHYWNELKTLNKAN